MADRPPVIKRLSRDITKQEDIDFIINTDEETCCKLSFIMNCFGEFDKGSRFYPYDIIKIPPGVYGPEGKKNKNTFTTTVGIFIFNRAFIEKDLFDLVGYIDDGMITKKKLNKLNEKISYAFMEDKIDVEVLRRFVLKLQKFQPYCNILSYSFDEAMLTISYYIKDKKEELLKKYKEGLDKEDPTAGQKVEEELLAYAKELLNEAPSTDFLNSLAKTSWGNNFKNMFVIRGTSKRSDPANGEFMILKDNYIDGFTKEEYADFADALVGGPYARARKTETGGALEKQFVRAFQHLVTGPEGSDCGTKRTISVHLTEDNIKIWMYNYIVEGNKLIELTSDNKDKYLNKTVNFRFSIFCEDEKYICSKCAGNLFYRLDMKNIGVASFVMGSSIKNVAMKAFHDSTVKLYSMKKYGYDKIFGM